MSAKWLSLPAWVAVAILPACAATFPFEVLGVSDDWIVIRENIPVSAADTDACRYPGLDPSQYAGARVHFVRLPAEAKRGRLVTLEATADPIVLYAVGHQGQGCTPVADAERRRTDIAGRGKSLGIEMTAVAPTPVAFGSAVPANACVLAGAGTDRPPCRREFRHSLKDGPIRIAISLAAVPEAPDPRSCQFVGYRFGVALQVAGLDLGKMESGTAPGGFANHYDCRNQQFDPLRLYVMNGLAVLAGGFSGANMADRAEHPFVVIFPATGGR